MSAAPILQLDLKPSLKLASLLLVAHALAFLAVCVSLAGWPRILVGFGILLSGTGCLAEVLQRSSWAIRLCPRTFGGFGSGCAGVVMPDPEAGRLGPAPNKLAGA